MITFLVTTLIGALGGLCTGFLIAANSRDGIWPNVFALLVLIGAGVGAIVGLLAAITQSVGV